MKFLNKQSVVSFTAIALLGISVANANLPKPNVFDGGNRWLITGYFDEAPGHTEAATQGICFLPYATVGTHIRGRWYSDTFPDWNGIYTQEGDQVFMHGDYAQDVGHDSVEFEIATNDKRNVGAGHWREWREDGGFGNTIGFANARLQRVGRCHVVGVNELLPVIPPRLRVDGSVARFPMEAGQAPLDEVLQFDGLKLEDF